MVAIYEAAPPKEDDLGNLMAILEDTVSVVKKFDIGVAAFVAGPLGGVE